MDALQQQDVPLHDDSVDQQQKFDNLGDVFITQQAPSSTRFPSIYDTAKCYSLVKPIKEMRQRLQHWELPPSLETRQRLKKCKLRISRRRGFESALLDQMEAVNVTDDLDFENAHFDKRKILPAINGKKEKSTGETDEEKRLVNKLRQITQEVRTRRRLESTGLSPIASESASPEPGMVAKLTNVITSITHKEGPEDKVKRRILQKNLKEMLQKKSARRNSTMPTDEEMDGMTPEQLAAFHATWQQVLQCRYIRGYEPPDMRLPDNVELGDFVFDKQ